MAERFNTKQTKNRYLFSMLIFAKFKALFARRKSDNTLKDKEILEARWRRDPMSHPDLRAMSRHELADLPFDPASIDSE